MRVDERPALPPRRGLALEVAALHRLAQAPAAGAPVGAARVGRPAPVGAAVSRATAEVPAGGSAGPGAAGAGRERLIVWEAARPCVVLPRRGSAAAWADAAACAALGAPLLRRASGGGAVVIGPGCLNVALVLSLDVRPALADVAHSYAWLLGRLARVLALPGLAVRATDLALGDRKVAGSAQRRVRGALLHHAVLLYAFDLPLIAALLPEPRRRPAWRGGRTHREFLTNLPLARAEIVRRLRRLPAALTP